MSVCGAQADERTIIAAMREFWRTDDLDRQRAIVEKIAADPAYARARVSEWLHAAIEFEPAKPGELRLDVPLVSGETRSVLVRIPPDYDPTRPWPMIYALHGTGGDAAGILRFYERLLGERADEFLIAAPDRYHDMIVYHPDWPPLGEHPTIRAALRRRLHVDNDRVYVSGYSRGGHATWMQALLHADEFAGALALAGTFVIPEHERLWASFVPNLQSTYFACVWGENDVLDPAGRRSAGGGITGLNRGIRAVARELSVPLHMIELPDHGHGDIRPPASILDAWLAARRAHAPPTIAHTFRHESQAQAYWLEANEWTGAQWTDQPIELHLRAGESANNPDDVHDATARAYRQLLGELRGRIDGQQIRVSRKHIKELTVWLLDGMVDWEQPVTLIAGGREVFGQRVAPSLHVCLTQARRTYDFDRLRWAGLRYRSGGRAKLVTPDTSFPDLLSRTGDGD
ncbi:MAG: hypothetical protein D6744_16255 [Planctomycetota bacterium]|nr:MAG: hypothetical protein D6744_16255 [Planctomycetota bacterium]